jgi:hypothetical protein
MAERFTRHRMERAMRGYRYGARLPNPPIDQP